MKWNTYWRQGQKMREDQRRGAKRLRFPSVGSQERQHLSQHSLMSLSPAAGLIAFIWQDKCWTILRPFEWKIAVEI